MFRGWRAGVAVVLAIAAIAVVVVRGRAPRGEVVDIGAVATREVFRSYVTASGEIVATRFADIGSSVMGRIVALRVAEGDRVTAGQVLVQLDPVRARSDTQAADAQIRALEADQRGARQQVAAARSALDAAKARAVEAAQTLRRSQELLQQGLTPAAERDAALAAANAAAAEVSSAEAAIAQAEQGLESAGRRVAQAQAQAAGARDVLSKTQVVAPMSGVVTRLNVREGEMVVVGVQNQPGTILMTVSDLDGINAEVKVAEADVLRLTIGQTAEVVLDALPGRRFAGRVIEVGASALPVTGTGAAAREFRVVVRLDAPDPGLRPGLTCDAEILADERRDATTVPLQAVVLRPQGSGEQTGVFAVRDGRAVFTPVTTGLIGGLEIEVTDIAAGTAVVVGPFQILRTLADGAAIRGSDSTR